MADDDSNAEPRLEPWEMGEQEGCSHPDYDSSSPCLEETTLSAAPVYCWSAPTSPLHSRGLPKASLTGVLRTHDVMHLAKGVLEERQSISACEARFQRRSTKPWGRSSVTKTTPPSLIATSKDATLFPPEGWRTVWSADDCNQMRAADEQVAAQQARLLKQEQLQFNAEVAATMTLDSQGMPSRGCSSCGCGPSSNGADVTTRASSPAAMRQQQVLASAQRIWEDKIAAMKGKLAFKHTRADTRTVETSRLRAVQVANKQQGKQTAMASAKQRHATVNMYRTQALTHDLHVKQQRRSQGASNKEAGTGAWQQERSTARQQVQDKVQQRQRELQEQLQQHKLHKLQALEHATTAAATMRDRLNHVKAERVAAERGARFSTAAKHAARIQQARAAMAAHVLQDMQRIDAMNDERARWAQQHDVQVQHQQLTDMVARHYAREFEFQAKVQNKLPIVDAATLQTLARFNLHV